MKPEGMETLTTRSARVSGASRVTAVYLAVGLLWITLTDTLLAFLGLTAVEARVVQTAKGAVFVLLSAALLYWLVRREARSLERARQATDASERRARAIFETALEGMLVTDEEGRIVDANDEVARIYGKPREELIGMRPVDVAEDEQNGRALREQLLTDGRLRGEVTILRANGLKCRVAYSSRADFLPGENLTMVRDVTVRWEAERALRESEETYRLLFENNPHPMFVYDPRDLGILAVNRAAVTRYGYSEEEFLSLTLRDIRPPTGVPELERMVAAGLPRIASHTTTHQTSQGRLLRVEVVSQAIRFWDRDARMVVATDRTEQVELREQLHHSQRLEAIGRLAGGVAHDFNNLLTVISGFGELLAERLAGDGEAGSQVEQILEAARRASRLTAQLLAFGRRQVLRPTVLDLDRVVEGLESMLARLLGEDVELVTRLGADSEWVEADRGQIEQVLVNLAVNARDAMPEGGTLTLATQCRTLEDTQAEAEGVEASAPYVVLSVSDTGQGVPSELHERIFEPFFTTKEVGRGSGLGLATAYGIVRQSGGFLDVVSEPGEGATFRIFLPRIARPEANRDSAVGPAEEGDLRGSETILVVEDQEQVRRVMVRGLRSRGYQVVEAPDATRARQLMLSGEVAPDLVVTDVGLPDERGPALVRKLREHRPDLPALFVSGYAAEESAAPELLADGAFLSKPFSALDLARRVRQILDRSDAVDTP